MKILHIGNVAGVSSELSRAQRKIGHVSDVLVFSKHPFDYPVDILLPANARFPFRAMEKTIIFPGRSLDYDAFHFHGGADDGIMPKGLDFPLWRLLGKNPVIHHHGHDIRYKRENIMFKMFAKKILVATPDLLRYSPDAAWLPSPLSVEEMPFIGVEKKTNSEPLTILHAPTDRPTKGTEHIINAVEQLKKEGRKVELSLVEKMPHDQALSMFKKADIVVDQLKVGWYGMFALECMSIGKPVCCYIDQDLNRFLPSPMPVLNATPNTVTDALRNLLTDYELRAELGRRGRNFVETVHEPRKVAARSLTFYE